MSHSPPAAGPCRPSPHSAPVLALFPAPLRGLAAGSAAAIAATLCLPLLAQPAQAAGSVAVRYVDPAHFTDIGFGSLDRERTLRSLTEVFEQLGRQLPDGQTLSLEVLDVDLAGEVWPRIGLEYRVLRGGADWPRMTLRYTLQADGRTLKAGESRLADMTYLFTLRGLTAKDSNLPYERRMVERWFGDTFPAAP